MTDTLLAMLTSCTRIEVTPRFDEFHKVSMVVILYREKVQIAAPYKTDFSDCSKLLTQLRSAGFHTAYVGNEGLILERS